MVNNKAYCCSLPLSKEDMTGLVCDYIYYTLYHLTLAYDNF